MQIDETMEDVNEARERNERVAAALGMEAGQDDDDQLMRELEKLAEGEKPESRGLDLPDVPSEPVASGERLHGSDLAREGEDENRVPA